MLDDFFNKEASTQACQLEILTETKCVFMEKYEEQEEQVKMSRPILTVTLNYFYATCICFIR